MHRDNRFVDIRDAVEQGLYAVAVLLRYRIAHGIGNINRRRACRNHRLHHLAEIINVRACRVLGGEFHVVRIIARPFHRGNRHLQNLLARFLEFEFQMYVRGREKRMYPPAPGGLDRLGRPVDILVRRPRQTAYHRPFYLLRYTPHRLEIAFGRDREPGLDYIHLHPGQLPGDHQLLLDIHGTARRLLAVAQGSIEYFYDAGH